MLSVVTAIAFGAAITLTVCALKDKGQMCLGKCMALGFIWTVAFNALFGWIEIDLKWQLYDMLKTLQQYS